MIKPISCFLTDVVRITLASCDYNNCRQVCMDYLVYVSTSCSRVFDNQKYLELWDSLFTICNDIGEQTSPFYLDR